MIAVPSEELKVKLWKSEGEVQSDDSVSAATRITAYFGAERVI